MSDDKHTPGPWTLIPAVPYDGDDETLVGSFVAFAGIEGADGTPVCVFGDSAGSAVMFENAADHYLIASAPDLLCERDKLRATLTRLREENARQAAEIETMRRETVLQKAAAEGAGSLLLDVQRECIEMRKALNKLERAAFDVSRYGATTGPQWTKLSSALIYARAALTQEPTEPRALASEKEGA